METKEHLVPITDRNTKQIIDAIGDEGIPVAVLKRKFTRYKVKQALQKIKLISSEISASIEKSMERAFTDFDRDMQRLDRDMRRINEQMQDAEKQLDADIQIIEMFIKRHEGKDKQHIRLCQNVKAVRRSDESTVLQVKEKP